MLTRYPTTNETAFFFSYFKCTVGRYFHLFPLSAQQLGIWMLRCWTLAFYMHLQIWLFYWTFWHFQRSQPLLVHLVSPLLMCLCSTWVFTAWMSEVWALLGLQRGLIGTNNQCSAGPQWSFLPVTPSLFFQAIIREPKLYPTGCRNAVAQQILFEKPIGTKARDNIFFKQLTSSLSLSSKRFNIALLFHRGLFSSFYNVLYSVWLSCRESSCPLQYISTIDRHWEYDCSSCCMRHYLTGRNGEAEQSGWSEWLKTEKDEP